MFITPQVFDILLLIQDKSVLRDLRLAVANDKYLVGIGVKRIVVWDIVPQGLGEPRQYALESSPSIASPKDWSCLIGNRLLLVNNNPGGHLFQVWSIPPANGPAPTLECFAESIDNTELIFTIDHNDNYVVASTKENIYFWDITQEMYFSQFLYTLGNYPRIRFLCQVNQLLLLFQLIK